MSRNKIKTITKMANPILGLKDENDKNVIGSSVKMINEFSANEGKTYF